MIVSDLDEERLEHALALGADVALGPERPLGEAVAAATDGGGVDVAAVTIGVAAAAEAALASLARGGRLNLFAGFGFNTHFQVQAASSSRTRTPIDKKPLPQEGAPAIR